MIIEFLKTERTQEELRTTLEVIREFKKCESEEEWVFIPLVAWAKLEQLEEFLDHLVNGTQLAPDSKEQLERLEKM